MKKITLFLLACGLMCSISCKKKEDTPPPFKKLSNLRTLKVTASIPIYLENEYWKKTRKFRGAYCITGDAHFSVDLSNAKYEEIVPGKVLKITLPLPAATDHQVYRSEKDIFWEDDSIQFGLGKEHPYEKIREIAYEKAKEKLAKQTDDPELIRMAKQQTGLFLETFYQAAGFETVTIEWSGK